MDLKHPYRLLIAPDYDEIPQNKDGDMDWSQRQKVMITGVEDTHG